MRAPGGHSRADNTCPGSSLTEYSRTRAGRSINAPGRPGRAQQSCGTLLLMGLCEPNLNLGDVPERLRRWHGTWKSAVTAGARPSFAFASDAHRLRPYAQAALARRGRGRRRVGAVLKQMETAGLP